MRRSGRAFIQPFCMFQSITEFLTGPVPCLLRQSQNPRGVAVHYAGHDLGRSPHAR